MYPLYRDIRSRLGEPLWHDEHGVPRYEPFKPGMMGIYDRWQCLFVVRCQACGRLFDCASGWSWGTDMHSPNLKGIFEHQDDPIFILPRFVSWGDAPWHNDENQCAGTTMSTDIAALKEVWHNGKECWESVPITVDMIRVTCDGWEAPQP